ncbi:probable protein phosphatase 2C 27 [Zingiber officinale]|uniref:probable protein phosphatase 2C 27 n=1 Tax=Zingiber officinale TaxID=94328 RepID=UPI001C4B8B8D|nr:probable protein phosphatase 2C 27 [Zingiber officinale]
MAAEATVAAASVAATAAAALDVAIRLISEAVLMSIVSSVAGPSNAATPTSNPTGNRPVGSRLPGFDLGTLALISPVQGKTAFLAVFRSGSCSKIGQKSRMEDVHICIDNLVSHLGASVNFPSLVRILLSDTEIKQLVFAGFDGHGGSNAAYFVKNNILNYIIDDKDFP